LAGDGLLIGVDDANHAREERGAGKRNTSACRVPLAGRSTVHRPGSIGSRIAAVTPNNFEKPLSSAPTQFVEANGIRFAYSRFGKAGVVPIVFNQHYTGTMDYWDPAVTRSIKRVVVVRNAQETGTLLERLRTQPGHIFSRAERTMSIAVQDDILRQTRSDP
jgi:hypothetical protein